MTSFEIQSILVANHAIARAEDAGVVVRGTILSTAAQIADASGFDRYTPLWMVAIKAAQRVLAAAVRAADRATVSA